MRLRLPRLLFLRRRSNPAFTAFCDGVFLLAAAAFFFPSRPWVCVLAAATATIPGWLNLARERRCARRIFAPDPLAPEFRAFAKAFLTSAEETAALGGDMRAEWTLCPVIGADGAFVPYSVDLFPAKGEITVGPEGGTVSSRTDVLVRPRLPIPVVVRDAPVALVLSPAPARRQVFLDGARVFHLPWNRQDGNWLGTDIAKLWPAIAFALGAAFPDSTAFAPERLAALAALLVFATFAALRASRPRE